MSVEDDDVGWFDYSEGDVEGRAPDLTIWRLVKAQLSTFENTSSQRFHLRFTLACGTGNSTGADAQYEVHLRQCLVEIETENCEVDLTDAYCFELPPEILEEILTRVDSESLATSKEIGGGAEGKLSLKNRAILTLKGKASRTKMTDDKQQRKAKGRRRIMLISCNGDYWTVGDGEYGDPRRHNGWLDERYFNEDKEKPLCAVDVRKGITEAKVTVAVRAKCGHLDITILDAMGRPASKAGPEYAHDVANALRERLKGIAFAKAIHDRQRDLLPSLPPAEFELARQTVIAHVPKPVTTGVPAPTTQTETETSPLVPAAKRARRR
jgi:hypothetical protein